MPICHVIWSCFLYWPRVDRNPTRHMCIVSINSTSRNTCRDMAQCLPFQRHTNTPCSCRRVDTPRAHARPLQPTDDAARRQIASGDSDIPHPLLHAHRPSCLRRAASQMTLPPCCHAHDTDLCMCRAVTRFSTTLSTALPAHAQIPAPRNAAYQVAC